MLLTEARLADFPASAPDLRRLGKSLHVAVQKGWAHYAERLQLNGYLPVPRALLAARNDSEDTAREIDRSVRTPLSAAFDKALGVLTRRCELLERGAQQLLQKEALTKADLALLRPAMPSSGKTAQHEPQTAQETAPVDVMSRMPERA